MIAFVFIAPGALALLLGALLGVGLLPFRRTRRAASFFLLVPGTAVGGEIFGFWLLLTVLHGRVSPQQAMESSFYFGAVLFYVLGLGFALAALLPRTSTRTGVLWKGILRGIVGAVALCSLAVIVVVRQEIDLHRMAAHLGTGVAGWDPVSAVSATPAWRVVPGMLIVFAISFSWSVHRLRSATP